MLTRPPPEAIVVFAGPSLPPPARPRHPRLRWSPPAAAGDLLALQARPPAAVVLIDGLFDATPAVRHKEILALMARGTLMFGAASMGALRAAELAPFGMIGVGRICAAYRAGLLSGDDEVALAHGPAELGWPALSEPLVNVRATLLAARRGGVIAKDAARRLVEDAQSIFYQDRTWRAVLETATPSVRQALQAWLPRGRVDLKRRDAEASLRAVLAWPAAVARASAPPDTLFTRSLAQRRVAVG